MDCNDAQFYLRFRRPGPDELGPDAAADLDRHLAGCPACAAVARADARFDAAVGAAMRRVEVPVGLRSKLVADLSARRGTALRRQAYRVAGLAAAALLAVGLGVGVFGVARPVLDVAQLLKLNEDLGDPQTAEARVAAWQRAEGLPPLPEPFEFGLLQAYGTEPVDDRAVPVVVFRDRAGAGIAKAYAFRPSQFRGLKEARDAVASNSQARVYDPDPATGVVYVVVFTGQSLDPFLRGAGVGG